MIRGMEDEMNMQTNYNVDKLVYAIIFLLFAFAMVYVSQERIRCFIYSYDPPPKYIEPVGVSTSVQISPKYEQQIHKTRRSRSYDSLEMV